MMNWLIDLFTEQTTLQAIVILSLICAIGLFLGNIKIKGISLGVTFVFFIGIIAGHLGLKLDSDMLRYAEDFGLILFVYTLGLQVGPGFFSSLAHGGIKFNLLALALAVVTLLLAVGLTYIVPVSIPDMMGIFCGATTNTPALGALQQTLLHIGETTDSAAAGCAVAYPFGITGVIFAAILIHKFFVKKKDLEVSDESQAKPYYAEFEVSNPAIFGKTVEEIDANANCSDSCVITHIWKDGNVAIFKASDIIEKGDHVLVVCTIKDLPSLRLLFGTQVDKDWNSEEIDWDTADGHLTAKNILITRKEVNGKSLGSLRLRTLYGINCVQIYRGGVILLPSPNLLLQLGDSLTVVGERKSLEQIPSLLGDTVEALDEPNLISIFIGLLLGVILGCVPIPIPGIDIPVTLGLAGGPIIMGILIGTFGPRFHMVTYTTPSANLMLRSIGLSLFLAGLGIESGEVFFSTAFSAQGALWLAMGFILTLIPLLILGFFSLKLFKVDYASLIGIICGSMANPMALDYVNSLIPDNRQSIAYATVFALSLFARIVLLQIVVLLLL